MDESILEDLNVLRLIENKNNGSNERHRPSNIFSNFSSSQQLKKNKSSTGPYKTHSIMSRSALKTDAHWNWTNIPLSKTIIRMNRNYGPLVLIVFACFCFGFTIASKECQGRNLGI